MSSSHTVTVRATTTTTASTGYVYVGFIRTVPGILKVLETVLGIIVLAVVSYYVTHRRSYRVVGISGTSPQAYLFLVSFACLLTTLLLLITSLISLMSSTLISKSIFELMYHISASLLCLTAGLALVIDTSKYGGHGEGSYAAGVMALINGSLYVVSSAFSYKAYRAT